MKKKLKERQIEINNLTILVGDFSTYLSIMNRTTRQDINKETEYLNKTIHQLDLIDIYRTFHPTVAQYMFFSSTHGTFSKIDHMLGKNINILNELNYTKYIL